MKIRTATPDDVDAIARLHADNWRRHYRGSFSDAYLDDEVESDRLAVWRKRLVEPKPNQFVAVAEGDDGRLCGFICVYGAEHDEWGTLIDNLHVSPQCQGSGVGRLLMHEAGCWARQFYPDWPVHLFVLEQNTRAQAVYRHLGGIFEASMMSPEPGGGETVDQVYLWPNPEVLVAKTARLTDVSG